LSWTTAVCWEWMLGETEVVVAMLTRPGPGWKSAEELRAPSRRGNRDQEGRPRHSLEGESSEMVLSSSSRVFV
jgi:hypothetical protein